MFSLGNNYSTQSTGNVNIRKEEKKTEHPVISLKSCTDFLITLTVLVI